MAYYLIRDQEPWVRVHGEPFYQVFGPFETVKEAEDKIPPISRWRILEEKGVLESSVTI